MRYSCGVDRGNSKSQGALVIFDKEHDSIKLIARKPWQIKFWLFVCSLTGVPVLEEKR